MLHASRILPNFLHWDDPSAGAILVDTGLHPSIATDPKQNFGTLAARSGKPTLAAGEGVPSQLRKRGLEPGEIRIASFGRTFDLFGDGSIHLAYTPGHSPGHMSVVCRLKEQDFVIGGDAMYVAGQLDGSEPPPPRPADAHNLRRSLQELRLFHSQFPDAVITPGHDPEFYERVERVYR